MENTDLEGTDLGLFMVLAQLTEKNHKKSFLAEI
jgi:hypothetical protein